MDIDKLVVKEVTDVTVIDPATGKKTDIVISLHGMYSDRFRPAYVACLKRHGEKGGFDCLDAEFFADMTEKWKGATKGGKAYKFSAKNAAAFYSSSKPVFNQLYTTLIGGADFLANA